MLCLFRVSLFPTGSIELCLAKNRSLSPRVGLQCRARCPQQCRQCLALSVEVWHWLALGIHRLPFRGSKLSFRGKLVGGGQAPSYCSELFSAPGLTALHWNFLRPRPPIELELRGNWWKGGRSRQARKGMGREGMGEGQAKLISIGESGAGQQVSCWFPFPGFG